MATILRNQAPVSLFPNVEKYRIGIAAAVWNNNITDKLLHGAKEILSKSGFLDTQVVVVRPPGAFELPLAAQWLLQNAKCDGVIVLGSVIRGETPHFDFVCHGCTQGIMELNLKFGKPVAFGLLTDNTLQQAIDRSGGTLGNKGEEAALALLDMLRIQQSM
jgi:6,7-dimethyl-8-ribityllumazine synthase